MSRIWDEELREHGVRVIAHDPGDMDTPMHAQALPDADRSTLKSPALAAGELLERVAEIVSGQGVAA
jgi:NAD(P)-dependent dehydrogenase (short-subunit alcohol dehydrogenase family)